MDIFNLKYIAHLESEVARLQARETALLKTLTAHIGLQDNFNETVSVNVTPIMPGRTTWRGMKRQFEKLTRAS